jgi:predicted CoA-binding protein
MAHAAAARPGRILAEPAAIAARLARVRRVAVLGIKADSQSWEPAHYVPAYLAQAGFEVVPVPVYFPDVTAILGRPVYRRLRDIPGALDLVVIFRRAEHLAAHVDDLLAKRPALAWLQLGIRNDDFAQRLAAAGIDVVQDRCIMVDHRRWRAATESA